MRIGNVTTLTTHSDHKALLASVDLGADVVVPPPVVVPPTPPVVTPTPPEATVQTSQNGYIANDSSIMETFTIPGTDRKVNLRKGAPGGLLAHFAAWFDKNIESVDGGILDDWGYANRPIRGQSTGLSNHASGTALDINAPRHPLGKVGTFTPRQAAMIRAELARYEGAIRWGGDYSGRKDEMHFEIHADVATCERVLKKVSTVTPAVNKTPYDHLYDTVEAAVKDYGPSIGSNYKARRAFVAALSAALSKAPVPAYRKAQS